MVLDVSTTAKTLKPFDGTKDNRGGFQIIPADHGMSTEMLNARLFTQWMIVGPVSLSSKKPDGEAPLFRGYIRPGMNVECRIDGGDWEPLPEISGRVDNAFSPQYLSSHFRSTGKFRDVIEGVTHLRIFVWKRKGKD